MHASELSVFHACMGMLPTRPESIAEYWSTETGIGWSAADAHTGVLSRLFLRLHMKRLPDFTRLQKRESISHRHAHKELGRQRPRIRQTLEQSKACSGPPDSGS